MSGEVPSGPGSVFHFLDIFALGFGLGAVDSLIVGRSVFVVVGCVIAAIALHLLGTKWPSVRGHGVPTWLLPILGTCLLGCVVYYSTPGALWETRTGIYLLLLTWCAIGYAIYLRRATVPKQEAALTEEQKERHRTEIENISSAFEREARQSAGQILTLKRELEALQNIVNSKPNLGRLTIHSAQWVVRDDEQYSLDAAPNLRDHIKGMLIDSIDVPVTNATMGGDPQIRTHKILRLSYAYGSGPQQQIVKHEGEHLTLPELPDSRVLQLGQELRQKTREAKDCAILLGMEQAEVKSLREDARNIAASKRIGWPHLTVERETADQPSIDPKVSHRNKLRVIIKNDSGKDIEVWAPLWDESSEVRCQWPLGAKLQLAGPRGWVAGDWQEEEFCVKVPPQAVFRCWIGLMPPTGDSIERRVPQQRNGELIFPIKVENRLLDARVKV